MSEMMPLRGTPYRLFFFGLLALVHSVGGLQCGAPPIPRHAKTVVAAASQDNTDPNQLHNEAAVATYICDPGYELIGNAALTCSGAGKWQGDLPICGMNVALQKGANQSSTARGGSALNAVDGDRSSHHDVGGTGGRCSETNKEFSPWWKADLMQSTIVNAVRVTTRSCCDFQLHDLEIRVGNNDVAQRNPLCAWYPGTVDDAETKTFQCAKPLNGRYVFVQMVGVESSLSLCEVEVFSSGNDIPRESCTDSAALDQVVAYNHTCYEMHLNEGNSFAASQTYCQKQKGELWHHVGPNIMQLIQRELERKKNSMKTQMVWIGAKKDSSFTSRTWRWVTGEKVSRPQWGRDQPNNYNGEQNCAVLDGGRDWRWNDVGCNLDYFHWICMFPPLTCGHPDRQKNSTIIGTNYAIGADIKYLCPTGSVTIGSPTRTCLEDGSWSQSAPSCKHVDCEALNEIENGKMVLVDGRTTYNATAGYSCAENYTLVGESKQVCGDKGIWMPEQPKCLYGRCPALPLFERGIISMSGRSTNDTATFSCDLGHKLVGAKVITCILGGKWSANPPVCQFVDCGPLPVMQDGRFELINATTTFASQVEYSCHEDYRLESGRKLRLCQEDGTWSGTAPICKLVECVEPDLPLGGYITGFDFTIHSVINYHCERGHLLRGQRTRNCTRDQTWSGEAPSCTYIDCGALDDVTNGRVQYTNDTTHLESEAVYTCRENYLLEGEAKRYCSQDGKWSGISAQCREIRCPLPERPTGSIISVSSVDIFRAVTLLRWSDRDLSTNSFRIDSKAVYKCERGFLLNGNTNRLCNGRGQWTGAVPTCVYVDCGSPAEAVHGSVSLQNNATHFGSYVQYTCEPNYKLDGFERRQCLKNGTWSGSVPICKEITCAAPVAAKDSGVVVSTSSLVVGSEAVYSCREGRRLIGASSRRCLITGLWGASQPICEWVDCSQPEEVENARIFLVNETTIFGSVAEYHCVPGFQLQGRFSRLCGADAKWAGDIPSCIKDGLPIVPLDSNRIDGLSSERQKDQSSGVGVWIGVGAGVILVLLFIIVLLYFKMKRGSWIWAKAGSGHSAPAKRSVTMTPPNMPLPPTPQTHFSAPQPNNAIYSSANEIYEHLPGENHHMYDLTYEDTQTHRKRMNSAAESAAVRPRSPPPSPPAAVTVNGFVLA